MGFTLPIKTSHGRSSHVKISGIGQGNEALGQFEGVRHDAPEHQNTKSDFVS